jgi:hypothetical protein
MGKLDGVVERMGSIWLNERPLAICESSGEGYQQTAPNCSKHRPYMMRRLWTLPARFGGGVDGMFPSQRAPRPDRADPKLDTEPYCAPDSYWVVGQ